MLYIQFLWNSPEFETVTNNVKNQMCKMVTGSVTYTSLPVKFSVRCSEKRLFNLEIADIDMAKTNI